MKSQRRKVFFVHPDGLTNTFIQNSFDNPGTRNIRVNGESIQVYILTANQMTDLDSAKAREGLRYDVYEGNPETSCRLRGSRKAHINADSAKMIQALKTAKAIPRNSWREISWYLKNSRGKTVRLAIGDEMLYSRAEKTLYIFKACYRKQVNKFKY